MTMVLKCSDCWQKEGECICGLFGTAPVQNCWFETAEGKDILLNIVNEKFLFGKDGAIYCRKCKNESVACVCMTDEDT